eukprot:5281897-Pyramimonas_sp.AAC.1
MEAESVANPRALDPYLRSPEQSPKSPRRPRRLLGWSWASPGGVCGPSGSHRRRPGLLWAPIRDC